MAKTAYVTGSNGFLGLNLVEQLDLQGWRVLALHRRTSDTRYLKRFLVESVEGDINDPASLARTLPQGVDAVFHVAGSTSLWSRKNAEQDRINIEGTRNMVEAALQAGAKRFVHTSSISARGREHGDAQLVLRLRQGHARTRLSSRATARDGGGLLQVAEAGRTAR